MGSNTPNLGLYKPDEDEDNWGTLVNDNWDTIDSNISSSISELADLNNVTVDTLANLPASGDAGDWYFTSDQNGVYHDPDGNGFDLIAEHPSNISAGDLGFDPATQTELDSHTGTSDAHHTKTTSSEIDHNATTNYVANEHIDHSAVSITAGAAITGGGDLTTTRTLDAQNVQSITTATTAGEVDVILADASGGTFDVTLPTASTDIHVVVKKTDASSNSVGVATPNTETIDGQSRLDITTQYVSRTIVSDGTDYYIV